MNQLTEAKKVTMYNTVTKIEDSEVCNEERYEQLKSMPFIHIEKVERVIADSDYINMIGGITPAFKKMWDSI
jgi:hypothetical protein